MGRSGVFLVAYPMRSYWVHILLPTPTGPKTVLMKGNSTARNAFMRSLGKRLRKCSVLDRHVFDDRITKPKKARYVWQKGVENGLR